MQVGELTLESIVTDTTQANLVGDEDISGIMLSEGIKLTLGLSEDGIDVHTIGRQPIGEPQRDAVDEHYPTRQVVTTKVHFFLDVCPFRTTTFLMATYTFTELIVPDMGSSQINGIRAQAQRQRLSLLALTRALSTSNKDYLLHSAQTTK